MEGYILKNDLLFQQQLQRSQNQAYNLATIKEPNFLAGFISAGINYTNVSDV